MFNKYFCRKFQSKKVTVAMITARFSDDHPLFFWGVIAPFSIYGFYDMYTSESPAFALFVLAVGILGAFSKVFDHISVATCPLKSAAEKEE